MRIAATCVPANASFSKLNPKFNPNTDRFGLKFLSGEVVSTLEAAGLSYAKENISQKSLNVYKVSRGLK